MLLMRSKGKKNRALRYSARRDEGPAAGPVRHISHIVMAYMVMAYIVMAYLVVAHRVMTPIVMAYIVMADRTKDHGPRLVLVLRYMHICTWQFAALKKAAIKQTEAITNMLP